MMVLENEGGRSSINNDQTYWEMHHEILSLHISLIYLIVFYLPPLCIYTYNIECLWMLLYKTMWQWRKKSVDKIDRNQWIGRVYSQWITFTFHIKYTFYISGTINFIYHWLVIKFYGIRIRTFLKRGNNY